MTRPRMYDWDEMKRLRDSGLNQYAISKQLGCALKTVTYALAEDKDVERRREWTRKWRERRKIGRPAQHFFTEEELIAAIQEYVAWTNQVPRKRDFGTEGLPSATVAVRLFGSVGKAIAASGFRPRLKTENTVKPPGPARAVVRQLCDRDGCTQPFYKEFADWSMNVSENLCRQHYRERRSSLGTS